MNCKSFIENGSQELSEGGSGSGSSGGSGSGSGSAGGGGLVFKKDGKFWMEWTDFTQQFDQLYACMDFPESWHGTR